MSRVLLCPGPHQVLPNPPAFLLRSGGFLVCVRSLSESGRVAAALMPRVRHRSEAVDIDHGQLVYPSLNRFAIVMDLHELAPVGGRATSRRHRRQCEWFTQVGENLPDRPGLRDECDLPDVAAAGWALERKLLPNPGHQFRPSYVFAADTAWDHLLWETPLADLAHSCAAVCFGSLGQRSSESRRTIRRFVAATQPSALRVFDVNLRQDFYCPETILGSLALATALKDPAAADPGGGARPG